jgi:hypothetical protein
MATQGRVSRIAVEPAQPSPKGMSMPEVTVEELRRFTEGVPVGIFEGLNDEQLAKIAEITRRVPFAEGEEILVDGSEGDTTFLLLSGEVSVAKEMPVMDGETFRDYEQDIIKLPADWNPYYGERALFDIKNVNDAAVTGTKAGEHGVLHYQGFLALIEADLDMGYNVQRNVMAKMGQQLKAFNENIGILARGMGLVVNPDIEGVHSSV